MTKGKAENIVETIKQRTDIVEVIGQRVELNSKNKALCPFHEEKTPSFSVNPQGQYFYCFGCGEGGDVIRFIERYENKSFWESLTLLGREVGIDLSPQEFDSQALSEKRQTQEIITKAAFHYHKALTPEVREYLMNQRGFSEDTIEQFLIGFSDGKLQEKPSDRGYWSRIGA